MVVPLFCLIWLIPTALSVGILYLMFRPLDAADPLGVGGTLRLFYLIPLFLVWVVFLVAVLFFSKA